jgi:hypothetical protein
MKFVTVKLLYNYTIYIVTKYLFCPLTNSHLRPLSYVVEVCESDRIPNPIGFVRISEQKYTYRIGLIKLFRSRIGSDFDIRNKMN